METPHNKQNKWRATAVALAVLTVALAASLFATSAPADAKPTEYQVATQTDKDEDTDAEMDPWTWFCLVNVDAKDFAACELGHVSDEEHTNARFAARDTKTRGHDAPMGWLCPAGTTAVAFDHPIYDEETGLFVVDTYVVWYCLDLSGGPEG